eukprot:5735313-Heterocapsa_arctica.AAC.1
MLWFQVNKLLVCLSGRVFRVPNQVAAFGYRPTTFREHGVRLNRAWSALDPRLIRARTAALLVWLLD